MRHDSFTCETWLIHIGDTTHVYMQHDQFIDETWLIHIETWLIHMWDMTHSHRRHHSFIHATRPIYRRDMTHSYWDMTHSYWDMTHSYWDMTHSYMRHDSFIYETWLIHIWDMTHSYMRHDSCLIPIWDMTHSYMRHDSFIYETWLIPIETCLIQNEQVSFDMGWLPLVASLKLYVSFAKETCKKDDILQKRPMMLRSLLIVATPYRVIVTISWGDTASLSSSSDAKEPYKRDDILQKRPVMLSSLLIVATPFRDIPWTPFLVPLLSVWRQWGLSVSARKASWNKAGVEPVH